MEIRQFLLVIKHWFWLLVLGVVIGACTSYFFSFRQERAFQSSTRVQVMSAPQSADSYSFYTDQMLAKTYAQTLKTRPILDAVEQELGLTVSGGQITTRAMSDTQLIDITVTYNHPQQAADIANSLVKVFAAKNSEMQASRFLESEESLQSQLAQVDAQIQALQTQSQEVSSAATEATINKARSEISRLEGEILALQSEIDALNARPGVGLGTPTPTIPPADKVKLNEKQMRLQLLQNTYNLYQQIYINLVVMGGSAGSTGGEVVDDKLQSTMALYEQIRASLLASYEQVRLARLNSTSNIVQIEPALPNFNPIRPQVTRDTALGTAVGFLIAALIIFLVEFLDDTLKTADQVTRVLNLPVIGYIAEMGRSSKPYVLENPRSPVSESFRTLRTNIEFASVDKPLETLLVVSANPSEGKSTVAANLAVSFTQGGKYVLLIDADMRRPRIHKFFDLPNRAGLSDLFREAIPLSFIINKWKDTKLSIITSGGIPPNPADLISSKKMESVLEAGKNTVDLVIVDAPPFLVADASLLASRMDGVLLVIRPGKTPVDTARTTLEQMNRAGARILGVVMNRIPRNRAYYYGGYRYYSPYYQSQYHDDEDTQPEKSKKQVVGSFLGRIFKKSKPAEEESKL